MERVWGDDTCLSIDPPISPLCLRILEKDTSLEMVLLMIPVSTLFSLLVALPGPLHSLLPAFTPWGSC